MIHERIRIVVVDDHTLFRRGMIALLARELGFVVVGEAADGFEGIRTVAAQKDRKSAISGPVTPRE